MSDLWFTLVLIFPIFSIVIAAIWFLLSIKIDNIENELKYIKSREEIDQLILELGKLDPGRTYVRSYPDCIRNNLYLYSKKEAKQLIDTLIANKHRAECNPNKRKKK